MNIPSRGDLLEEDGAYWEAKIAAAVTDLALYGRVENLINLMGCHLFFEKLPKLL